MHIVLKGVQLVQSYAHVAELTELTELTERVRGPRVLSSACAAAFK